MTEVIEFRPRGSYLGACRHQGVYQHREEMLAEIAALSANINSRSIVVDLSNDLTVQARIAEHNKRLLAICEAYQAAGFGDDHFELLKTLMFQAGAASCPQVATKIFEIQSAATRKSSEFTGPVTFRTNGSQT